MTAQLPAALKRDLADLAALPQCPHGSLNALAEKYGARSPRSLAVLVYRMRQAQGRKPRQTNPRASLSFLTPQQRADYAVFKAARMTRAEAMAALGVRP